jgi:hypothetical protein
MKRKNLFYAAITLIYVFVLSCNKEETFIQEINSDTNIFSSDLSMDYDLTEGEIVDLEPTPEIKDLNGKLTLAPSKEEGYIHLKLAIEGNTQGEKELVFNDLPVNVKMIKSSSNEEAVGILEIDDFEKGLFFSVSFLNNGDGDFTLSICSKQKQYNCKGIIHDVLNSITLSEYISNPQKAIKIKHASLPSTKESSKLKSSGSIIKEFNDSKVKLLCSEKPTALIQTKLKVINPQKFNKKTKSTQGGFYVVNYALFHEIFFVSDPGPNLAASLIAETTSDIIDVVVFKDAVAYDLSRANVLSDIIFYNRDYLTSGSQRNLIAYQLSTHGDMSTAFQAEDNHWITDHDIQNCWGRTAEWSTYPTGTVILTEQCYGAIKNDMAFAWLSYGASAYVGNTTVTPGYTRDFIVGFWNAMAVDRKKVSDALAYAKAVSGDARVQQFKVIGNGNKSWPKVKVVIEAENYSSKISRSGHYWDFRNWTGKPGWYGWGAMQALPSSPHKNISTNYQTTSPELRYTVNFPIKGTYYVWVRGWAYNTGENSVHVGIDGQAPYSSANIDAPTGASWKWTNKRMDGHRAEIYVSTNGVHTVNVWMRENGYRMDQIILAKDYYYQP